MDWDGEWRFVDFTPPTATAVSDCNDAAPTWTYQMDIAGAGYDLDFLKGQIDSMADRIWLKPQADGSGSLDLTITVYATLPTGETSSFMLPFISKTVCVIPPPVVDQVYYVTSPTASYNVPIFTLNPDPLCPQSVLYYN